MKERQKNIIVGVGELLWDVFPDMKRPGGAPANVAFHCNQLGNQGVICSRVGEDDLGRELTRFLTAQGLETAYVQRDSIHPTGRVTVDLSCPDEPSYLIHENVAWDSVEYVEPLERLLERAAAICFGTLAQRSPKTRETIQQCLHKAQNALTVYDVNLRQIAFEPEWIEHSLEMSQIVKLNIDEVVVLSRVLSTGSADPGVFAKAMWTRYGVEITCVTRAEKGCLLFSPKEELDVAGEKIDLSDPVGAGDAFTAALISSFLWKWPLYSCVIFANKVGALVASQSGAMPDLKRIFSELIQSMEISLTAKD